MGEMVDALLEDYQTNLIEFASEKIHRPLTDKEIAGIKQVKSFLMLEAIEMNLTYDSEQAITEMLEFHANYDWITGEKLIP